MSMRFFHEDEQGHVVDEHRVEPTNLVVDEGLLATETISFRTIFLMNKPLERPSNLAIHPITDQRNNEDVDIELCNKRHYTLYSDDEETKFCHLYLSKSQSASATMRQLDIHIRATRRWVKCYHGDPKSIFEKKKKSGRRRILGEQQLNVSRNTVYNFMTIQCNLSIKKAQFHPVERNSVQKVQQRHGWFKNSNKLT
ncbi:hypothetical protein RO3G_04196 [Rhizopus delemar RA 99-880]|uniref:Uncharacterized protein n=1 Tax=Rhizopus delemar (strain RA 99-880 / ATCC MYA-4621 / FGSC 9543 / NRRL 43880) TaxID=246409 RepID=I1BTG1_RHIO9|nr:hypothetical protein RO3G_04196 [Rhizopus delemar RA 99-880]|eukprot:EIE79491.1 hypothetical protein RO3G_04196 [Rhizopus delemar RA 99-880]